jgi:hypothetical protein
MRRLGWLLLCCALPALGEEADGGAMAVESFEAAPVEDFAPLSVDAGATLEPLTAEPELPGGLQARLYGDVRGETSVDTRFDSPRHAPLAENVAEGRFRVRVGVDLKLNAHVRVVVEGRAQLRLVTQRAFDRAKGTFEPTLGEAFVDLYTSKIDLRLGQQRLPLGANVGLAPADALNPRDLRESLISGDPEDVFLPVFALRAQGELGTLTWLAAYVPFFTPSQYAVFGQDEALLQPALAPAVDTQRLDPSIEDGLQAHLLETQRPSPFAGDFALRLASTGRVKLGASWVWENEKLPRVTVDPELAAVLAAQAAGRALDNAALVSLMNRFQAGQSLATGVYRRSHLFSLELSTLLGPGQLDVDLTYSPRQTYFDASFAPLDKASVTWVVGYSQASDSPWVYSLQYLGLAVPDVGAHEQLVLMEPATAAGAARTAFFHLIMGLVARPVWHDRLELSLRAAFEPVQKSFALSPRVTFQGVDKLKLWLSGEVYEGPAWSPFGYFSRNSKVLVGARYDW